MRYVMGFDGGGTKTDCVLMDETRAILGRGRSGASNPARVGLDVAVDSITEAAEQALAAGGKSAAEIASINAGIAGVGSAQAIPELVQRLKHKFPNAHVLVLSDLDMSLAATQEIPSIAVIAGTGTSVLGRSSPENFAREGGFGPILGDPGSAYDIGRKAVIVGLRQWRSREDSLLGKEILHEFHCDWAELQNHIRANAESILPRVFPIVTAAASRGDDSAIALLRAAAEDLSELVVRVIQTLKLQQRAFFLAKIGGVFYRSSFLDDHFDALIRRTAPKASIGPLPEPIAEFAARAAVDSLESPARSAGG
jgi:N-acetylglucosamine kinase-like BadF-type ATPase